MKDETKTGPKMSMGQKLLALGLSALAAKFTMMALEKVWTKGLNRSVPFDGDDESSLTEKLAWMGITAAAVSMAREMAKELAAPVQKKG